VRERETVVDLSAAVAQRLDLDPEQARAYAALASLGIDTVGASISRHDRPLTPDERARLCQAPAACAALASKLAGTAELAPALRAARERWDGSGYPDGLAGAAIPPLARAFAVADAWLALRSDRPFRPALSAADTADIVRGNAGTQFDPQAAAALLEIVAVEDPAPTPAVAPPPMRAVVPARRRARAGRPGTPLGVQFLVATIGAGIGLWLALPMPDVHDRCPPAGEGLVQCQLQKSVLPATTIVLGCMIGALILLWLVTQGLPGARAWWRAGGRRSTAKIAVDQDPVLLAANWGLTYRDAHPDAKVMRGRRWKSVGS